MISTALNEQRVKVGDLSTYCINNFINIIKKGLNFVKLEEVLSRDRIYNIKRIQREYLSIYFAREKDNIHKIEWFKHLLNQHNNTRVWSTIISSKVAGNTLTAEQ